MSHRNNIKRLITNYNRRLQKLKEKQALQGIDVDPDVVIEIEDIEVEIEKLQAELKEIDSRAEPPAEVEVIPSGGDQGKPYRLSRLSANRDDELSLFKRILTDPEEEHILLIEAPGGQGKSTLLKEFRHLCPPESVALIDLKGQAVGLHEVFSEVCDILGWPYFHIFAETIGTMTNTTIPLDTFIDSLTIEAALKADDESSRRAYRLRLSRAFFEDLRRLSGRPVLIFDTFEAAPPDVAEWFREIFLRYTHRNPNLVVVIAGRTVPAETVTWSCRRHTLPPIDDPVHWQHYCRQVGLVLKNEWIEAYCVLFKGHPYEIVKALVTVAGQGG